MSTASPQWGLHAMGIANYLPLVPADPALAALDALMDTSQRVRAALEQMERKAAELRAHRQQGRPFAEIVAEEQHPLVVEMLTSALDELADAGSTFRRAKARALHDEGLSQETIAGHFGVTRQRIAALLADPPPRRGRR